jgi:hypothetical protein
VLRSKVPHLEFLTPDERVQLLEHYRDYCRAAIRHQERTTREFEGWLSGSIPASPVDEGLATREGVENAVATTQHVAAQWLAELAWVDRLLENVSKER